MRPGKEQELASLVRRSLVVVETRFDVAGHRWIWEVGGVRQQWLVRRTTLQYQLIAAFGDSSQWNAVVTTKLGGGKKGRRVGKLQCLTSRTLFRTNPSNPQLHGAWRNWSPLLGTKLGPAASSDPANDVEINKDERG